jgi:hypothetical protein
MPSRCHRLDPAQDDKQTEEDPERDECHTQPCAAADAEHLTCNERRDGEWQNDGRPIAAQGDCAPFRPEITHSDVSVRPGAGKLLASPAAITLSYPNPAAANTTSSTTTVIAARLIMVHMNLSASQ